MFLYVEALGSRWSHSIGMEIPPDVGGICGVIVTTPEENRLAKTQLSYRKEYSRCCSNSDRMYGVLMTFDVSMRL